MWLAKMLRSKRVWGLIAVGSATIALAAPSEAHRRGGGSFFGFSAGPGYSYYRPPTYYYVPSPPPVYYSPAWRGW
jgi:hypothetical protein